MTFSVVKSEKEKRFFLMEKCFAITGPPTHSVRGQTSNGRWRLSSSSVTLT